MQMGSNEMVTVAQLLNFQLLKIQRFQYSDLSTGLYLKLVESSLRLSLVLQEQYYYNFPMYPYVHQFVLSLEVF